MAFIGTQWHARRSTTLRARYVRDTALLISVVVGPLP
jgi:hypothetical protein